MAAEYHRLPFSKMSAFQEKKNKLSFVIDSHDILKVLLKALFLRRTVILVAQTHKGLGDILGQKENLFMSDKVLWKPNREDKASSLRGRSFPLSMTDED